MTEFSHIIYEIIIWLFLLYGALVLIIYGWIGIYALGAVLKHKKQNVFTDYSIIASNPNAPSFSILAPAYNEGATIVENVRSLLSLYYHNLEIIIINDGSKDNSIEKLIAEYDLEKISFFVREQIPTQSIKGIYKSKNEAFKKLIVVDKENGGKADALNVGINVSSGDYLVCIDVDCILEQDSILKLAKPFLEQTDKKLIACGGVIRLVNNCKVENGKVTEVNLPKSLLGKSQALEYVRAFILGRMAWSRASGLILISGAFGVFDRKIVLECGGYDKNTVGEDMELVVRMRKHMEEKKVPYEVRNIPDPLCWTEAPETKEVLRKQRNRWMRGTMETLWKHRKLMFNPKYGKLGMISLPFWLIFEFLGPIIEFFGYVIFVLFIVLGIISWPFVTVLTALVLATGCLYSIYAILIDIINHHIYKERKDFFYLFITALLEPFFFHPFVVKASVQGFLDYFKKNHAWGDMTRQGFSQNTQNLTFKEKAIVFVSYGLKKWGVFSSVFFGLFSIGILAEYFWYRFKEPSVNYILENLIVNNLLFFMKASLVLGAIYVLLNAIKEKYAKFFAIIAGSTVVILQYILFLYFSESNNLLGADFLYYNTKEMMVILKSSGMFNVTNIGLLLILITICLLPLWLASKAIFKHIWVGLSFMVLGAIAFCLPSNLLNSPLPNDYAHNMARSKWSYFFESNKDNYLSNHPEIEELVDFSSDEVPAESLFNKDYPFWKKENTEDFLGQYFNKSEKVPNLVFIVLEGMGHAYSSPNGYVGNFTPYLDSLKQKSLYWENNLSTTGRTFGMLSSMTGSLPFGKNGFLEIEKTPNNFNLFNILKKNGFETGFYYGGNSDFDGYRNFLKFSRVDQIKDQFTFESTYKKLPANEGGESWGFEDQAVFSKVLKNQKSSGKPYFNVILTLSTHSPFLINNRAYFERKFNQRIQSNLLSESQKKWALQHEDQLVSVLNSDEALRGFLNSYSKRPDYNNTIFVVTGDHAMPEITMETKIDRYHVPLLIYSPLLKESRRFQNIVSHFDVAPSILAYYRNQYKLKTPSSVSWMGTGFSSDPKGKINIPLMQSKSQLEDFVSRNYHIKDNEIFLLERLRESKVDDVATFDKVNKEFKEFKKKNAKFITTGKLMPDSVYVNFLGK